MMQMQRFTGQQPFDQSGKVVAIGFTEKRLLDVEGDPAAILDEIECFAQCRFRNVVVTQRGDRGQATEVPASRSEEHTSELQSLMRISYAVFCLKKKKIQHKNNHNTHTHN